MFADGDAMELNGSVGLFTHTNQREVRRAAADVANQDCLPGGDSLVPVVGVFGDPGLKCRLGFLDQHDFLETGELRGSNRQFTRDFIERGRQSKNEILLSERMLGKMGIPSFAHLLNVTGADGDGRATFDVGWTVPGEQIGRAVDAGMTKPAFGGSDQAIRDQRAVIAGELTDDVGGVGWLPREFQGTGREFFRRRLIQEGRQRIAGFDLSGRDDLRQREIANLPGRFLGIDIGDGGIGCAEIETDNEPAGSGGGHGRTKLASRTKKSKIASFTCGFGGCQETRPELTVSTAGVCSK